MSIINVPLSQEADTRGIYVQEWTWLGMFGNGDRMEVTDNTSGESWVYFDNSTGQPTYDNRLVPIEDIENGHDHFTVEVTMYYPTLVQLESYYDSDFFGPEIERSPLGGYNNEVQLSYISDSYNENVYIEDNAYSMTDSIRTTICPKRGTVDTSADSYYMEYTLVVRVKTPSKYVNVTTVYKITVISES